jgi:hypothetical protein
MRVPVRIEWEQAPDGEVVRHYGATLNLSRTGMLVACDAALAIGADLDLMFQLQAEDEPIVGCARVVRQARGNLFGLEFWGLEGDGADRITRLVATASGGVAPS